MKKHIIAMAVCIITVLFAGKAFAFEELPSPQMTDKAGFVTVITDVEGDLHTFQGIIDVNALESYPFVSAIKFYEVHMGGTVLIKTELKSTQPVSFFSGEANTQNGYYMVDFTLLDSENTKVFLTGLTANNLEIVQSAIVNSVVNGKDLALTDIEFIDTEKQLAANTGDSELCWAASMANALDYTLWGKALGEDYDNCDKLFKLFNDNFSNAGGNPVYGIRWFINGYYPPVGADGWSQPSMYPDGNGFFSDYSFLRIMDVYREGNENLYECGFINNLRRGDGGMLGIDWCTADGNKTGGHDVALWGFIYDEDYEETDEDYINAFIISDSDDDKAETVDRTKAPNKLRVCFVSPSKYSESGSWEFDNYGSGSSVYGMVGQFTFIRQYDALLPWETSAEATKALKDSPDLFIPNVILTSDVSDITAEYDRFSLDTQIYLVFAVENAGGSDALIDENDGLIIRQTVRNKTTGQEVSEDYSFKGEKISSEEYATLILPGIKGLEAGDYSITLEVNATSNLKNHEAYYYNNSITKDVTITENFLNYDELAFTAEVGEFANGKALVNFTYEGLDKLNLSENYFIGVRYFYTSGDEKTDYTYVFDANETTVSNLIVPESCYIEASGDGVVFELLIFESDLAHVVVEAEKCALNYTKILLSRTSNSTETFSPLESGATALAEGEQIAFTVVNNSAEGFGGEMVGVNVSLVSTSAEEPIALYKNTITLDTHEASEEVIINSWAAPAYGTYKIRAEVSYSSGTDTYMLGEIKAEERASATVTIGTDTNDKYDGKISLREAIAYSDGEEVTVDYDKAGSLLVANKIDIDKQVVISFGGAQVAAGKTTLFEVGGSGDLVVKNSIFSSFDSGTDNLFDVSGGRLRIEDCRVINNRANHVIYASGGTVELLSCSFKANVTSKEIIFIHNNGKCEILNSILFLNECEMGGIIRGEDNSEISLMYSSLTDNNSGISADSSSTMCVLGSVVTGNYGEDISGNAEIYASAYGTKTESAKCMEGCFVAKASDIFVCDGNGLVIWKNITKNSKNYYMANAVPLVAESGLTLENKDGKIAYTLAGKTEPYLLEFETAMISQEFSKDMYGDSRRVTLGGGIEIKEDYEILGINAEGYLVVYAPKTAKVAFIQRAYTNNNEAGTIDVDKEHEFSAGTNYEVTINAGNANRKFMIWDNLIKLQPLCRMYEK